jgi:hypothetical protein
MHGAPVVVVVVVVAIVVVNIARVLYPSLVSVVARPTRRALTTTRADDDVTSRHAMGQSVHVVH